MSHYDDYCREREEPEEEREGEESVNEMPAGNCYAMWRGIHEVRELLGDAVFDEIPAAKFIVARDSLAEAETQIRFMELTLHLIAAWKHLDRSPLPPTEAEEGANVAIDMLASLACAALGFDLTEYRKGGPKT